MIGAAVKPTDRRSIISVECAVSRYARSVRQGSVPCRADGNAEGQAANYRDAAERTELRAEQVRHVIMAHGVSLIQFMIYRNFGLHVDKLCRDYSGESLRLDGLGRDATLAVLRLRPGSPPGCLRTGLRSDLALVRKAGENGDCGAVEKPASCWGGY